MNIYSFLVLRVVRERFEVELRGEQRPTDAEVVAAAADPAEVLVSWEKVIYKGERQAA